MSKTIEIPDGMKAILIPDKMTTAETVSFYEASVTAINQFPIDGVVTFREIFLPCRIERWLPAGTAAVMALREAASPRYKAVNVDPSEYAIQDRKTGYWLAKTNQRDRADLIVNALNVADKIE